MPFVGEADKLCERRVRPTRTVDSRFEIIAPADEFD
jgi:hypothetical protein